MLKESMKPLPPTSDPRRLVLQAAGAAAVVMSMPALASSRRALPSITEGPFYPPAAYLSRGLDWDADLTSVQGPTKGQPRSRAVGEHLDLFGVVADDRGRLIDGATVEIWQCDAFGSYRHPRGAGHQVDEGFQGFGSNVSDAQGRYRFRTIRPVAYPGRTPHIHVKLRHASFSEFTSQLFVAGDPGNERDGLYRSLSQDTRAPVDMALRRAPAGSAVTWLVEQALIVPA
jgi:protocatechuate 3,4-dioxygenase beta subunit